MFFTVDRETIRWVQKTLSRARRSGKWSAIFSREDCWTPAIFSSLVDEFDRLLLDGNHELAAELGCQLPKLASRIRPNACPDGQVGRRSLEVWGLAICASGMRATGRPNAARTVFATAYEKAKRGVHDWIRAELERRYGHFLVHLSDRGAFDALARALEFSGDHPELRAQTLIVRGVCRDLLDGDAAGGLRDFGLAASLSDPTRSERSAWTLQAALHNMAIPLVTRGSWSIEVLSEARKLLVSSRVFLGKGMDARKLRSLGVEGLLVYRIGLNRHGERLLERARRGFLKLGRDEEFAVVSLDLVVMLLGDGEDDRAKSLLRDICDLVERKLHPDLIGVLRVNLDLEKVQEARQHLLVAAKRWAPRATNCG